MTSTKDRTLIAVALAFVMGVLLTAAVAMSMRYEQQTLPLTTGQERVTTWLTEKAERWSADETQVMCLYYDDGNHGFWQGLSDGAAQELGVDMEYQTYTRFFDSTCEGQS